MTKGKKLRGSFTRKVFWAGSKIKRARKKHEIALKRYREAQASYEAGRIEVRNAFQKLGSARLAAAKTLGRVSDFLEASGLPDREHSDGSDPSRDVLKTWRTAAEEAVEVGRFLEASPPAGAAEAAGTFGLINLLGGTPRGVILLTLSGAAETNSALSWLAGKGGAHRGKSGGEGTDRLGGTVAGPGIVKFGYFAERAFEDTITKAVLNIAEMDMAVAEIEKKKSGLGRAMKAAAGLRELLSATESELLASLEEWRVKPIREGPVRFVRSLLFRASSSLFPSRRAGCIRELARKARVLAGLLDVPLLDERGRLVDIEAEAAAIGRNA